jgi:hypothetical protein
MAFMTATLNDDFEAIVAAKMKAAVDGTVREVVLEVLAVAVAVSPVDTGLYRDNWQILRVGDPFEQIALGSTPDEQLGYIAEDPSPGSVAWIVGNAVPYAQSIEYGHSRQAPAGVLNIAVASAEAQLPAIIADQTGRAFA